MGEAVPTVAGAELERWLADGEAGGPTILIEWFTPDCVPCRKLQPILAAVGQEWEKALRVVRADASNAVNAPWVTKQAITAVPTLVLWTHGREVDRRRGFVPPAELRRWLEQHLGGVEA